MSLATVFLVLPLLSSSESAGVARLSEEHATRPAADSVVALLDALPGLEREERAVARFLVAGALAELGLVELAAGMLRDELDSPFLAGAAFVAWLRATSEAGEHERLVRVARRGPWDAVADEDFAEAVYLAARAAFETRRYPEARGWAREVPEGSPWYPFARYLLAQAEYALDRYAAALEAAEPIFSSRAPAAAIAPLRERTAVLLGDMLIEIGLYDHAIGMLSWPSSDGPFGERAERDRLVALGLRALEAEHFERGEALTAHVSQRLERLGDEIGRSVESKAARAARLDALRRAWPPRAVLEMRRRWTAARAEEAWERSRGWTFARVLRIAWASFPPVVLWRLAQEPHAPGIPARPIDEGARHFFAPSPEVAKLLAAAALLHGTGGEDGCRSAAVRERAAGALLGETPLRDLETLQAVRCDESAREPLEAILRERLDAALATEARGRIRELRELRFRLEEAGARARFQHQAARELEP